MKSFINKVRDFFAKRAFIRTKRIYIRYGTIFGDMVSYLYMGECCGFEKMLKKWERKEKEIVKYGYKPIDLDAFIDKGGYGRALPELEKLQEGEEPIFHAKIYREKFLGKVSPAFDWEKQIADWEKPTEGQAVAVMGEYQLPSTKKQ